MGIQSFREQFRLISYNDPSQSIVKLIDYLNNEGISYELSEHCRSYYDQLVKESDEFQSYLEKASLYKNSEISEEELA